MLLRAVVLAAALSAMVGFTPPSEAAADPIHVVVTIPVLKDLAEQVGGPHVRVVSLLSGLESEHTYSPKPSDVLAIRRARVVLQVGLGLEIWIAPLIRNARNPDLMVVTTSNGIALIPDHDVASVSAAGQGRRDHEGNPHVWLDPENAKIMMRHITEGFIAVDPAHGPEYRRNQAAYLNELDRLQKELLARIEPLSHRHIVVHHPAWPYFARRFGFRVVGEVVAQPGAEPSAQHLQHLVGLMRKEHVRVIVSEPQLSQKIPDMLARETGARVVVLTPLPGGVPGTDSYLDLLRYNVARLVEALSANPSS